MGNRQTKRNSAKKTKPTPKKKVQTEPSTFKRALFQSPDQLPNNAKQTQTPNSQRVHRSKRNLFANSSSEKRVNENGKRERIATRRISPRKRVNRSLSFQDSQAVSQEAPPHPRTSITQVPHTSLTLTGAHKQKMLWAATNALREEGMGMNHELFRPCMTVLFKTCQKLWLTKLAGQDKEGSTSENMLALTKQFSAFTIKEISADPTSEHMAKVYNDMLRMAETVLNQANDQQISSTSKQTYSKTKINEGSIVENQIKNNDNSINTFQQSETSKECSNKVGASNSNKVKPPSFQKRPTLKQTPLKFTSTKKLKDFSPKSSKNLVQKIDESADTSENSGKLSTPKGKNKLSKGNKLTSPGFMSPLTRSRKSAKSQNNSPCNFTSQESDKLSLEHSCANKSSNTDANSKFSKSILSQYSEKSYRDSTDNSDISTNTKHKIIYSDCSPVQKKCNSKKYLSQEILDATLDNKSCDGFEKNKENIVLDNLTIDNQKVVDSSHRLLSSVENTPQAQNRTLQLYKLSNSGGEHVDPEDLHCPLREPPKLMAPWEVQPEDTFDSVSQSSPPVLIPHWEQPVSGTSTSLPDSIMSHWQQMSANSVNTSDKIMFDYEDTSYEIVFPPTNEDDTRASSVCVPFDYPHLVEDSKSCFNSVFITEGISGTSNSS